MRSPLYLLGFYFDLPVEGDIIMNMFGFFFGVWIVPGSIFVNFAIGFNVVVAGLTFPKTACVLVAFFEVFPIN